MIHPFHPLFGRVFPLVDHQYNWGENRVYFSDDNGQSRWMPATWTDVEAADPFVAIAAGRAAFRAVDLLELARLIAALRPEGKRGKKPKV